MLHKLGPSPSIQEGQFEKPQQLCSVVLTIEDVQIQLVHALLGVVSFLHMPRMLKIPVSSH